MASTEADEERHAPVVWKLTSSMCSRLDLDSRSILMILKGALPPTIVTAISQSNAIADITLTVGYLATLMSVTSQCLMPRAKFIKIMLFNLLAVCVAASLCCLANYSAVKARQHSTPSDASESVRTGYNSDACVVAAVWLFILIWPANAIRAWRPMELQDPMVSFSIFSTVTITRIGTFVTTSEGLEFIARLLKTFLIGFAIASAVSLLVLPITSRSYVFQDMREYASQVQNVLESQINFLKGSSASTVWVGQGLLSRTRTALSTGDNGNVSGTGLSPGLREIKEALNLSMNKLNALHSKLHSDLFYSKDEIAWGKLAAEDLSKAAAMFRDILLSLSGMTMLPDILDMIVQEEISSEVRERLDNETFAKHDEVHKSVMMLHKQLVDTLHLSSAGLQYFLLTLELISAKQINEREALNSNARDEESSGECLNPLQTNFAAEYERSLRGFYNQQTNIPEELSSVRAFSDNGDTNGNFDAEFLTSHTDVRLDFFLLLYMGQMQRILLNSIFELVMFADSKVKDGTMKSNRFIFPREESVRNWFSLKSEQKESESDNTGQKNQSRESSSTKGAEQDISNTLSDPEHLPPVNIWEKASSILRYIPQTIQSELSVFGFRVAAASFCVAILAFLRQTQEFFFHGRCIWAMIVIVIGMSPTSGQTLFGFMARIIATTVSMILSLIVWYIVDEKTPGIIVFLYFANVFEYYFYVKKPQYFGPIVISIVTLNVIVGYELQVRKLGVEVATSNDQPYYPIYIFGPYKLAAVAAGCAISFFWVIFPYPITAKSKLRKLLGHGLFNLAQFYGAMHETIEIWMRSGLPTGRNNAANASRRLSAVRRKLFKEEMGLLNTLRVHSHFTKFEPPIGGKFPRGTYDNIISKAQRLLTSMSLMVMTTRNLERLHPNDKSESSTFSTAETPAAADEQWMSHLAKIAFQSPEFKSHITSSLLCHLSASIMNAQPLPPYIRTPESFPLARRMQKVDKELLNIHHVQDPAFSAFVSLEVLRSVLTWTLKDLLKDVKTLVGELSFAFDVEQPESAHLLSDEA